MASGEPTCFALFCTHMKCLFAWAAILALGAMTCPFLLPSTFAQSTQYRTVIDKEVGAMYQNPVGFPWSDFGVFIGSPQSLDPDAARVLMAHFDKFSPGERPRLLAFLIPRCVHMRHNKLLMESLGFLSPLRTWAKSDPFSLPGH